MAKKGTVSRTRAKPADEGLDKASFLRRAPSQERGRESVADILAACDEMLGKMPFYRITVAGIAARAGLPVGTIYFFFPNKIAIFCSLIERQLRRLADHCAEAAAAATNVPSFVHELEARLGRLWEGGENALDLYFSYRAFPAVREVQRELREAIYVPVGQRIAGFLTGIEKERRMVATSVILKHIISGLDNSLEIPADQRTDFLREWNGALDLYLVSIGSVTSSAAQETGARALTG